MNQHNIYMHFKGYEDFVSRILDLQAKAKRYHQIVFTPFLNEQEQEIVQKLSKDYYLYFDGGYAEAERKIVGISYYEEEQPTPLLCLKATYATKYYFITHRDVLGSLLHLGIQRSVVGDIVVKDGVIYIFVTQDIVSFIQSESRQIKRATVKWEISQDEVQSHHTIVYEEKIVSSYRIDVIIAAIVSINREKAKSLIRNGYVKVNQVVLEDCAYMCHNNSAISIRGYGRFSLQMSERTTKKNRFVITIGKYL